MTATDRLELLRQRVAESSQAKVAKELGYSASTVNQVLKGSYAGGLDNFLERVAEVYGGDTIDCPVLGDIPLSRCSSERKKPFRATNHQAVELFRTCPHCTRRNPK